MASDPEITGLTADSREVKPGWLFAALPGSTLDGRAFIAEAVARGAVAVLAETGTGDIGDTAILITDKAPRRQLALMAARFHGRQPDMVAAITGTSGKTSTAEFLRRIWAALGENSASLGTLGIVTGSGPEGPGLTTPDPVALHGALAGLAGRGVSHLAMEASSHGLDQHRLDGVQVKIAAFLNLSHEHLDYHGSMQAYLHAKAGLFERVLDDGGTALLAADAPESAGLARIAAGRGIPVVTFGQRQGADFQLSSQIPTATGQSLVIRHQHRNYSVALPLIGAFQALNVLAAAAMAVASGADMARVMGILPSLHGVRGRLEQVARHPDGAPVFVDYAHKPEALETVLKAIRPHTGGALHVVFGCGGDRDRGKRPLMGRIAADLADHIYVTDDNPRTEPAAAIRAAIMQSCPQALEIGDREKAIATALRALGPQDALIIAGKGHETGQIVGTRIHAFDDANTARAIVATLHPCTGGGDR